MSIIMESMIAKAENAVKTAEYAVMKAAVLERELDASVLRNRELERKLHIAIKREKEAGLIFVLSNIIWVLVVITILMVF